MPKKPFAFVEATVEKVREKSWAGKAHTTLNVTGHIIEGFGKAGIPIVG